MAEPEVDFALLSCMHIPVRWQFLHPAQVRPTPVWGGQKSTATHVSTWLMASGHVHALKGTFPRDTVWGWNLWFDLSNKVLVLVCTAID
jgi:hypothetical protein